MKRFLGISHSVSLGIPLVMLLWGMATVAAGAELDSVVVMAINPETGHLLLAKLGIAEPRAPFGIREAHQANTPSRPSSSTSISRKDFPHLAEKSFEQFALYGTL